MQAFMGIYKHVHKLIQASISVHQPAQAYTSWVQQGPALCTLLGSYLHGLLARLARSHLARGCSKSLCVARIWVNHYMAHSHYSHARVLRDLQQSLTRNPGKRPHPPSAIANTHRLQSLTRSLCNRPPSPSVVLYWDPWKSTIINRNQ